MPKLNHLTIIGHAGRDSELKSTPTGKLVWTCSMALDNGKSAGKENPPTWVDVEKWENEKFPGMLDPLTAIKKGDPFFAEGQLRTRTYTDKQGQQRIVIQCDAMHVYRIDHQKAAPKSQQAAPTQGVNDGLPF